MKEFFDQLLIVISNPGLFTGDRAHTWDFGEWWIVIVNIIAFLTFVGLAVALVREDYPCGPRDDEDAWGMAWMIIGLLILAGLATVAFWMFFYITFSGCMIFLVISGSVHLPRKIKKYSKEKPKHYSPKEVYRQSILNR